MGFFVSQHRLCAPFLLEVYMRNVRDGSFLGMWFDLFLKLSLNLNDPEVGEKITRVL